ncbi:hypothetical protein BJ165DRAFT_1401989 [Panaeolus papilionaceus]|nr:hypothetical protein BJ165DRAFT_1401989 [Panaeolus papilionaceus]
MSQTRPFDEMERYVRTMEARSRNLAYDTHTTQKMFAATLNAIVPSLRNKHFIEALRWQCSQDYRGTASHLQMHIIHTKSFSCTLQCAHAGHYPIYEVMAIISLQKASSKQQSTISYIILTTHKIRDHVSEYIHSIHPSIVGHPNYFKSNRAQVKELMDGAGDMGDSLPAVTANILEVQQLRSQSLRSRSLADALSLEASYPPNTKADTTDIKYTVKDTQAYQSGFTIDSIQKKAIELTVSRNLLFHRIVPMQKMALQKDAPWTVTENGALRKGVEALELMAMVRLHDPSEEEIYTVVSVQADFEAQIRRSTQQSWNSIGAVFAKGFRRLIISQCTALHDIQKTVPPDITTELVTVQGSSFERYYEGHFSLYSLWCIFL